MKERPEQTFFDDPAIDRAVGMIMALASEVYVLRDRQRCLEKTLEAKGQLDIAALDGYEPDADEAEAIAADREAFVAGLMEHVLGRQVSKGAP
jgi:hypothetical protein